MACASMPTSAQRIVHVLVDEECQSEHRGVRTSNESGECDDYCFTWIRALTARVRCGGRVLRLLLAIEHEEPAVDVGSDSVDSEGVTISISASASKISLG
jgi:hypothetical protein